MIPSSLCVIPGKGQDVTDTNSILGGLGSARRFFKHEIREALAWIVPGGLPALESLKAALDELQPGLFQLQLIPPWAGDGFSCPRGRKGVFFPASLFLPFRLNA